MARANSTQRGMTAAAAKAAPLRGAAAKAAAQAAAAAMAAGPTEAEETAVDDEAEAEMAAAPVPPAPTAKAASKKEAPAPMARPQATARRAAPGEVLYEVEFLVPDGSYRYVRAKKKKADVIFSQEAGMSHALPEAEARYLSGRTHVTYDQDNGNSTMSPKFRIVGMASPDLIEKERDAGLI